MLGGRAAATFAQITCNLFGVLRKATSVDASAILLARRKRHFATGSNMASLQRRSAA